MSLFICPKCNYEIKASIEKHVNSCDGSGPRSKKKKYYPGKRGGWNKGLKTPKNVIEKIKISNTGKKHSFATKSKLRKIAKKNGFGGITNGGGRGHSGWYKGYWCDSSWELAWVVYNLEHGIKFERNTKGFEYVFENKKRKYYPDFKINDEFIEIKGYLDKLSEEKIKQFKGKLSVLYKKDLQQILKYTIEKYGKDFIKLYNGPHSIDG